MTIPDCIERGFKQKRPPFPKILEDIWHLLHERGTLYINEIQALTGYTYESVSKAVCTLRRMGLVSLFPWKKRLYVAPHWLEEGPDPRRDKRLAELLKEIYE